MKNDGKELPTVVDPRDVAAQGSSVRPGWLARVNIALTYPVRVVASMPDLKRPVADPQMLPENTNWISSTVAMWGWAWRMLEYKIEPTGKGFSAWVKLLFLIILCVGLPYAALVALASGGAVVIAKLSGLTIEALKLSGWLIVLGISVVVLMSVSYLVYAGYMILRRKPIPVPEIKIRKEGDDNEEDERDNVIDVGENGENGRQKS